SWNDRAANVILALGRRGAANELGVPGEELAKVAYRVIEPEVFAEQRVLVVGGGNAAADCAIALAEQGGCRAVGLSYRRAELGRVRASVKARIDALIRQAKILPYFGTEVVSIAPEHVMLRSARGLEQIANDHVIIQIGGTAPSELLHSIGIELVEKRGEA
ncbi:MAG: NAD(P)-binding domain-containing protein, partial [Kofleriaceae bacterium]